MITTRLQVRIAAATLVSTLVAAGTLAAVAVPASAAVPGLTIVTATSATDSNDNKGVTAYCPAGTVPIGTGATLQGALGQVNINSVVPSSGGSVSASAYENTTGTTNLWSVTAQAICANTPANHMIVYATSPQTAANKSVTAVCPGTLVTIGSGALLSGSFGDVELEQVRPQLNSVTATGNEIGAGIATAWSVVAYAVCADSLAGLVTVATSSADTAVNKNVVATCPAGKEVLNAAGRLNGGDGRVVIDEMFATRTTVTATGKEAGSGTGTPWRVQAIALCATP